MKMNARKINVFLDKHGWWICLVLGVLLASVIRPIGAILFLVGVVWGCVKLSQRKQAKKTENFNFTVSSEIKAVPRQSAQINTANVTVNNIMQTPHPLRGWTNLGLFEVHGMNPKTGKQNKKIIEALDEATARSLALAANLTEPITVTEMQRQAATERQIAYGAKLGINITERETSVDASALLTMYENDESPYNRISLEQWNKACSAGVCVSALTCQKAYRELFWSTYVYRKPNSKVYHHAGPGCCYEYLDDATVMYEDEAIAKGLLRCKRCNWDKFDSENDKQHA